MEQLEKEKNMFLSLCSPYDRNLLTGRIKMTLQDELSSEIDRLEKAK